MNTFKFPTGQGYQYVMAFDDYIKYGFDESRAWKEPHNPPIYPDCKREIKFKEKKC